MIQTICIDKLTGMNSHDLDSAPRMPLWVKVFGIGFLVLVLVFVIMALSGHGPGNHMS